MSADLFAAFGDTPQQSRTAPDALKASRSQEQTQMQGSTATLPDIGQTLSNEDDDDDFGDFEDGQTWSDEPIGTQASSARVEPDRTQQVLEGRSTGPETGKGRDFDVLFDAEVPSPPVEDDFGDFQSPPSRSPQKSPADQAKSTTTSHSLRTDGARPTKQPTTTARPIRSTGVSKPLPPSNELDLLGFEDVPPPPPPKPPGHIRNKSSTASANRSAKANINKAVPTPKPVTSPNPLSPEAWDDFPTPTPTSPSEPGTSSSDPGADVTFPPQLRCMLLASPVPAPLPPSNVPPPSVLLSLFPPIFTSTANQVLTPLLALPPASRTPHLRSAPLTTFLKSYLALLHTLAHVLAGRKQRWKRDRRLAQSMSIGPSSGKGMKLSGLDRSEQAREDQVVGDVLAAYAAHAGPLKALVGGVNAAASAAVGGRGSSAPRAPSAQRSSGGAASVRPGFGHGLEELMGLGAADEPSSRGRAPPPAANSLTDPQPARTATPRASSRTATQSPRRQTLLPPVPELGAGGGASTSALTVRNATAAEGGIASGTACCAVCGLRREERVGRLDVAVQDSFGEWWVEGGTNCHVDCWRFWEGFRGTLLGRG